MTAVAQFPQGIDHPLVTVRNHAEALELYRRMGFAPSPVSYHPWGSVTSLMMFPSNFIELIGVDDPSKFGTNSVNGFCFGRQLGQFLDRGEEGVSLVALHSKDANADHGRMVEAGLDSQGRIDFRRRMTLPMVATMKRWCRWRSLSTQHCPTPPTLSAINTVLS